METFTDRTRRLDSMTGVGRCFDMIGRELVIGGRRAKLWVVNGYAENALLERLIAGWLAIPPQELPASGESFLRRYLSAADAQTEREEEKAAQAVLAGKTLLCLDGYEELLLIDAKTFPIRSIEEPDTSRVLRGSHDGFVENLMENAALLRRRIRTAALTLERCRVGGRSGCDVVLAYLEGKPRAADIEKLRQKLSAVEANSVSMSQESIAESILPSQWWNPFPRIRYTERPDVATACLMEGSILLLVDNSPCVMLLPTTVFSFAEEINDYYFPPLVGTYLQAVRLAVLLLTVFITPLWYVLVKDPAHLHENLRFLLVQGESYVPLILQLLLVEFIIDVLKLASLNTPNVLSNSFSMLGALILGDFAVQSRWLVPEVLVYMAFVAVADYAQHSYEMSYACKLLRMAMLLLVWRWDWWGFGAGALGALVLLLTVKPLVGRGYLYPLIPFDGKVLWRILHRQHISRENT